MKRLCRTLGAAAGTKGALPAPRALRPTFAHDRVTVKEAVSMKEGLPSFGELCALASQKNHMALYVCESDIVKVHLAQLGKVK